MSGKPPASQPGHADNGGCGCPSMCRVPGVVPRPPSSAGLVHAFGVREWCPAGGWCRAVLCRAVVGTGPGGRSGNHECHRSDRLLVLAVSCVLRLMSRSRRVPRQWPASSGPGWGGAGIGKIRLGIGRLGTDRWGEIGESRMREFGGASRSIPHRSSEGGQVGDHCSGFKVTAKATGGAARSVVLVENGRSGSGVGPGHWIRMK